MRTGGKYQGWVQCLSSHTIAVSDATQPSKLYQPIVEAQDWIKTADGMIMLVASAPQAISSAYTTSKICQVTQ
ncbi:hypothetical protein F7734_14975 [Scytonema sp. UIC 10036]|uniref:hypothetical protein n=1 Tax=Scytonema sp. UIC 10036 TaxID=2304196 RepID=UPI0012DAF193|nr:hypothetical protein [Scytonema sp. UIC 10036]MUG93650.1 hypothetical protein [Scytonema sp. UIC 10036]